jgi:SulP family sulfate permease
MKKTADTVEEGVERGTLEEFSREKPWADEGELISRLGERVYIKHLDGPLFFGFVSSFRTMMQQLPDVQLVIIRMKEVPYIDQSGLYALEDAVLELQQRGVAVIFTGMADQVRSMVERIDLVPGLIPAKHVFESFGEARTWLNDQVSAEGLAALAAQQRNAPPVVGDGVDEA